MFAVLLAGILQGVECPGSVHSITPQWWHLMVLQYEAASFHLPSVSTAHTNTGQHKTIQQYVTPTIPSVVIFKVLLPQPNIMEAFFRSNSSLLCDVCPDLPTKNNHNIKKIKFLFSTPLPADPLTLPHKLSNYQHTAVHTIQYATSCWPPHTPAQNAQLPTHSSTYNSLRYFLLTPSHSCTKFPTTNSTFNLSQHHRNVLITLLKWVTNYWYWIVAEWNSMCRFRLEFEMVYWRQICISMKIASFNVPNAEGTAVRTAVLDLELLKLWEGNVMRNVEIDCDWNKCRLTKSQTNNMKLHITYIIKQFSWFGTNTSDIAIKCL